VVLEVSSLVLSLNGVVVVVELVTVPVGVVDSVLEVSVLVLSLEGMVVVVELVTVPVGVNICYTTLRYK
jgi:hypothetical protein